MTQSDEVAGRRKYRPLWGREGQVKSRLRWADHPGSLRAPRPHSLIQGNETCESGNKHKTCHHNAQAVAYVYGGGEEASWEGQVGAAKAQTPPCNLAA